MRYADALDTLADKHADRTLSVLEEAAEKLPPVTEKSAMAHVALAKELSQRHVWRAERQGRKRWAADVAQVGNGAPTQVVVLLPQLEAATPATARIADSKRLPVSGEPDVVVGEG